MEDLLLRLSRKQLQTLALTGRQAAENTPYYTIE
jgi:hypothetical protein